MSCQTRKERWKKPPSGTSTPWRSSHERVSQRTWRPSASSKSLCCSTSPAAGGKWMWVQSTQFHKTLFLLSLFNHSDIMRNNWDCPDYINLVWSPHVKWLFGLPIQPIDNLFLSVLIVCLLRIWYNSKRIAGQIQNRVTVNYSNSNSILDLPCNLFAVIPLRCYGAWSQHPLITVSGWLKQPFSLSVLFKYCEIYIYIFFATVFIFHVLPLFQIIYNCIYYIRLVQGRRHI